MAKIGLNNAEGQLKSARKDITPAKVNAVLQAIDTDISAVEANEIAVPGADTATLKAILVEMLIREKQALRRDKKVIRVLSSLIRD